MNSRVGRPLLGIALSSALLAGGATFASPAFAADPDVRIASSDSARQSADVASLLRRPAHPGAVPGALTGAVVDPSARPVATSTTDLTPTDDPTPTGDPTPADPAADTTAPTGSYQLSVTSVWVGQRITLTDLGVSDDVSGPEGITRTVTWGDGVTSTLTPGAEPIGKRYAKAGKFTITVTLTDEAGNSAKATLAASVVTVTVPGKSKLSTGSVYTGGRFTITFSNVPAGTSRITLDWGDGYVNYLAGKNQSITGLYYRTYPGKVLINGGIRTLKAAYTNQNGISSPILIGNMIIKRDLWKPTVKITKPAKPSKVASWSTVRGTAADKGSGVYDVVLFVGRESAAGYFYCYQRNKTWVYSSTGECPGLLATFSKGKWSFKITKLAKSTLYIAVRSYDWTDKGSSTVYASQKLTS